MLLLTGNSTISALYHTFSYYNDGCAAIHFTAYYHPILDTVIGFILVPERRSNMSLEHFCFETHQWQRERKKKIIGYSSGVYRDVQNAIFSALCDWMLAQSAIVRLNILLFCMCLRNVLMESGTLSRWQVNLVALKDIYYLSGDELGGTCFEFIFEWNMAWTRGIVTVGCYENFWSYKVRNIYCYTELPHWGVCIWKW